MEKAGLIDEMVGDAIDSTMDNEDMEEEMEEQINQVLDEIAGDTLASMPNARVSSSRLEIWPFTFDSPSCFAKIFLLV